MAEDGVQFGTLNTDGTVTNTRVIQSSDIAACPHVILVPEHYRDDGSCKCDDPENVIMAEWGYEWNPDLKQWDSPKEETNG